MRADLSYSYLKNFDLSCVNLMSANLESAYLCGADLSGTNLNDAILINANFCGADLSNADLCYVNSHSANFSGANLRNASLIRANLSSANLRKANLQYADLGGACLDGAVLREADLNRIHLSGTNLAYAVLQDAKNIPYIPMACPEVGSFTAFKKCKYNKIVELLIPKDAKRSSATSRKCRCDKAKVVSITNIEGTENYSFAFSKFNSLFLYEVGKTVTVDDFDDDRWNECSTGIHFFVNRQEAVDYLG